MSANTITWTANQIIFTTGTGTYNMPFVIQSYLAGGQMSNTTTWTSNCTQLTFTQLSCADVTNQFWIQTPNNFVKNVSSTWVFGNNAGGMASGLTFNTSNGLSISTNNIASWFHVHSILFANGSTDIYFDNSVTAINAPSGTIAYRRLGSIAANSSNAIFPFSQNGDEFLYVLPIETQNAISVSAGSSNIAIFAPLGVRTNILTVGYFSNNSGGIAATVYSPDLGTETTRVPGSYMMAYTPNSTVPWWFYWGNIRTNSNSQIGVTFNGGGVFYLTTYGYIDRRGRDN